jgi:hypothetical protein
VDAYECNLVGEDLNKASYKVSTIKAIKGAFY